MSNWLARHRYLVLAASLAVAVLGVAGALQLSYETDSRVYFERDSAERLALDAIEARHGRFSTVVFVVVPEHGDVYAQAPVSAIAEIVRRLQTIPEVAARNAITELAGVGTAAPDDSRQRRPFTDADLTALRDYAKDHPRETASLVAKDGSVAAVIATLNQDGATARTPPDVMKDLKAIRDAVKGAHPDLRIMLTGSAALDATFADALQSDLLGLIPAQVLLLVTLLLVTLGSITATLALFAVLGVAAAVAMGMPGWLGIPLNGVTSAVPTVLLGLAVATSVHIILAWQHALRADPDARKAVAHTITINAKPVSLAIITTVVSFLCLNFSSSPPFRQFGDLVALGLVVMMVLSFTLLPALLLLIPPSRALSRRSLETAMFHVGAGALKLRYAIIAVFVIVTAISVYGIDQLRFDDTFAHYFDNRFEFRQATDLYEAKLTGITVVEFSLPSGDGGAIATRDNLSKLRDFVTWLEGQPKVATVTSILDLIAAAGHAYPGALDSTGLPASDFIARSLVDAYLQSTIPGAPPGLLDAQGRYAHVSVVLRHVSSAQLLDFADVANREVSNRWGPGVARATGGPLLAAHLSATNTRTMFIGTLVALAIISVILAFALGGLKMGLVSLVPNLVPLVLAYGFWGLAFEEVSFAATFVVAMTFGIVVDDTVHIMSRYQYLRNSTAMGSAQAILESFRTVGVAVVITSVAIASGFAALSFSGFLVNQQLGLLTVITLIAALLTDVLLLPVLLLWSDRRTVQSERLE